MDAFSIAAGAAGVGLIWFLKLGAAKALPAALGWLKARWTAGKVEVATLAELQDLVAEARRDIDEIKAKIEVPLATASAAPDPLAPAFLQPAAAPGGQ